MFSGSPRTSQASKQVVSFFLLESTVFIPRKLHCLDTAELRSHEAPAIAARSLLRALRLRSLGLSDRFAAHPLCHRQRHGEVQMEPLQRLHPCRRIPCLLFVWEPPLVRWTLCSRRCLVVLEYTTRQWLSKQCSATTISIYHSHLSGSATCGGGFGILLVFVATISYGFSEFSLEHQVLAPVTLLLCCQLPQLVLHVLLCPRKLDDMTSCGRSSVHITIPMTCSDRRNMMLTTAFFDFSGEMIRSAWAAVGVMVMVNTFGVQLREASFFIAAVFFVAYPALSLFAKAKWLLAEETWLHVALGATASAIYLMIGDEENPNETHIARLVLYMFGSLVFYCVTLIHGSASDSLVITWADSRDPCWNLRNVSFWKGMSAGFLGRVIGPVAGRIAIADSEASFSVLTVMVIGLTEVMTLLFVSPGSCRRGQHAGASFGDRTPNS
eukprot:TRINITY_DN34740_c0_g1_i2.p1 TRINITY_DN34740_c0_g1~~TRINITY_DN34740_c0_g1_i2.p1  ORF type:complete len:439 (+),score=37.82 TRINITY_DN34740_c0_g1_i2:461-1777(+)